ncbi:MAG: branched-chain amino acid aminotransferase [Streptosporangiaceae bacterium]|nr:branched-chain amino acid aminotransferase [Streptosporangiaceae bacterium]
MTVEGFGIEPAARPRSEHERKQLLVAPGWGRVFTDHMVTMRFDPKRGWHDGKLTAFAELGLAPSCSVLHYGQAIFEGLKAYQQRDGSVAAFRPDMNAQRFAASARRLAMPELPAGLFLDSLRLLVSQDRAWVPQADGESLYLRPLEIAADTELMTRPSHKYLYVLIASPVGSYFPRGVKPVTVWVNTDYPRAVPGGTGAAKFAGNYAGAMLAQQQAEKLGCDQVVWLDSAEHRYVEELGGMNLFFVLSDGTLVTAPLSGTILPGVTRASILTLGRDLGLGAEERSFSFKEWQDGAASGAVAEAFACGTAAVITPVGEVRHQSGSFQMSGAQPGEITTKLRKLLLGIQYGAGLDRYGWMTQLAEP